MDKLITVDHAICIVDDCCCKNCKKQIDRICPSDCEILEIKYKLSTAEADAVLVAVEARLI